MKDSKANVGTLSTRRVAQAWSGNFFERRRVKMFLTETPSPTKKHRQVSLAGVVYLENFFSSITGFFNPFNCVAIATPKERISILSNVNRAAICMTHLHFAITVTGNQVPPAFWTLFHNSPPSVQFYSLYIIHPNTTFVIFTSSFVSTMYSKLPKRYF